ncbi:MAG: hypothetical protein JXQ65_09920 [Candidatus Marinimicrobia bacterium]|nr:hypothetical protein [Candidatus Neomarinimicrobiota bacterium]
MPNYQLTEDDKQNFNLFLNQYYLASVKALKFVAPIILGIFLIAALLFYILTDGFTYIVAIVVGLFLFFRARTIKIPEIDLDNAEIMEASGKFKFISNAGHRVIFNHYHAYNVDLNKLQQAGLFEKENVTVNYVILRADRKMIYVFDANGHRDISLPVRK